MGLSVKLELRQSQTLTLTPQLMQAIKLLQLSNLELAQFVEGEIERNPLLERTSDAASSDHEDTDHGINATKSPATAQAGSNGATATDTEAPRQDSADIVVADMAADTSQLTASLDSEREDIFPEDDLAMARMSSGVSAGPIEAGAPLSTAHGASDSNLEEYVSSTVTLRDHLCAQVGETLTDPTDRLIAYHMIDCLEDSGYLYTDIADIADRLGTSKDKIADILFHLQTFDPAGIFARDLAECLELQLRARGRFDPLIARVLQNLDLLAKHDLAGLKRLCKINDEDLADTIAEIRSLNPKPGHAIGGDPAQLAIPDVFVRKGADGAWMVELNADTLPRVLVNRGYYRDVVKVAATKADKTYLSDCYESANWLVRSLEQRARTILLVASEIVRQQDAFLVYGVQHLKPMNLKMIAEAIDMHESTISRVTSNKYIATPRGIFELKYFFTSSIASADSQSAHSSEAVRHRIKILVDNEKPSAILSDNDIVKMLKNEGIAIARRTVTKYREALGLPSSVVRRREKRPIKSA